MAEELEEGIGLADAIDQVRAELAEAAERGRESAIQFRAEKVELELLLAVSGTKGVSGGVKVSVISLGAKGEWTSSNSHRIAITLRPLGEDGRDLQIDDVGPA